MIEVGKCEPLKAQNVVLTIKRPWWAFWRKNKVIEMPNAVVSFGDFIDKDGNLSVEVDISGLPNTNDTEN